MIILTCICDIMQILRYFIKMYGFIKKICKDLYGFLKIRTMYGQYIPYNPYIVATLYINNHIEIMKKFSSNFFLSF